MTNMTFISLIKLTMFLLRSFNKIGSLKRMRFRQITVNPTLIQPFIEVVDILYSDKFHIPPTKSLQSYPNARYPVNIAAKLVNSSPRAVQPYLKLVRLDRPNGTLLIYLPCCWGISLASSAGSLPDPYLLGLFACGSIVMRGAGCIINDMWDRDIDANVCRTALRPLVTGEISMLQASLFLVGQLGLGLTVLLQLNGFSAILGGTSLELACIYPLMKRITNWPQLTLGVICNWGVLLGYSAVTGHVDLASCVPLYIAGVCWTIIYDTIYSHQDRLDDLKLGIKSTSINFGSNTKLWLMGFAAAIISNLAVTGVFSEQTWPYYVSIGLVGAHLGKQIMTLDINDPNDCSRKFVSNAQIGFLILIGIVLSTICKKQTLLTDVQ